MSDDSARSEEARQYAAAYAAHCSERDPAMPLQLYEKLRTSHAIARADLHPFEVSTKWSEPLERRA